MAGELTVVQLENEVLDNVTRATSLQTKSGTTLASIANRYLNRAQKKLARTADILFAERTAPTVADQKSYSFPSDLRAMYSMRVEESSTDLDSRKLELVMPRDFDKVVPTPAANTTGKPDWYVPYKTTNTFELFRIPDQAYTLRMRMSYWPATLALSDTSQTSDYTDADEFLIEWATYLLWRHLQEYADAKAWKSEAQATLNDIINEAESAMPDWAPKVRGFSTNEPQSFGEYYNNPFIFGDPSIE